MPNILNRKHRNIDQRISPFVLQRYSATQKTTQKTTLKNQDQNSTDRQQKTSQTRNTINKKDQKNTQKNTIKNKKKSGKRGNKKNAKNFSVWRAVTLFPRPSLKATCAVLIYLGCIAYGSTVVYFSQNQLKLNLDTQGVKRTFHARSPIQIPLPQGEPPLIGQILDQRPIHLWTEIKHRSQLDLKTEPPFTQHQDPTVNRKAWLNALTFRKVEFIESRGLGASGDVSLVWPPLPAPQPILVVGHIFDQVVWIHPQHGVVLSPIPPSWQRARSIRLPPLMSRRW